MTPRKFLGQLDEKRMLDAIRAAEAKTSGEIRVCISHKTPVDPLAAARAEFVRLGMTKTRERNGVLIFVAPKTRSFAIIGDEGIHAHCGEEFWNHVAATMSAHFANDSPTDALVHAVQRTGELLAQYFPRRGDDRNELADDVITS